MARFTPSAKTAQDFNNGVEYIDGNSELGIMGDAIQADSINSVIEGLLYTQGLAANQPDVTEADSYGTVSVETISAPDGTAKIKFKNLKGKQGIQGENGRPVFLYSGTVQKMSDGVYILISGKDYWSPTVLDGLHSGDIIIYTFEGITYIDTAQGIGATNKWQVQQDRLGTRITGNDGASVDTSNLVTTDTEQLISGVKRFAKDITVGDSLANIKYGSGSIARSVTSGKVTHTYNAYLPNKTGTIALTEDVSAKMEKSAFSLSGTTLTITL